MSNVLLIASFNIIIIHFIWWTYNKRIVFVCLFVWSLSSHSKCFTHMEKPVKGCKFASMLGTHGHWALNVPYLLWHWPTLYNCHLWGPVTLTPVAERLEIELSKPIYTTRVCRYQGSNPDIQHARWPFHVYAAAAVNISKYFTTPNTMIFFNRKKKWYWHYIVCMLYPY